MSGGNQDERANERRRALPPAYLVPAMPIEAPRNANIAKLAAGYLFPTIGRVRASYPAAAEREAAAVCPRGTGLARVATRFVACCLSRKASVARVLLLPPRRQLNHRSCVDADEAGVHGGQPGQASHQPRCVSSPSQRRHRIAKFRRASAPTLRPRAPVRSGVMHAQQRCPECGSEKLLAFAPLAAMAAACCLCHVCGRQLFCSPLSPARTAEFGCSHPPAAASRAGIGDTTEPLPPSVAKAMSDYCLALGTVDGYSGYDPPVSSAPEIARARDATES